MATRDVSHLRKNVPDAGRNRRQPRKTPGRKKHAAPKVTVNDSGQRTIGLPRGGSIKMPNDPTSEEAKEAYLRCVNGGLGSAQSLAAVGRTQSALVYWKKHDPAFKERASALMSDRRRSTTVALEDAPVVERTGPNLGRTEGRVLDYPEFSEKYLKQKVFGHTQNVIDLVEGRDPSHFHPAMTLEKGQRDLIVVNMPPEHGKTTSITINYVVHQIVKDPSIRILIVSKSQGMAKKFLLAVKSRLTSPQYKDLIVEYAPPGGFDSQSDGWTADAIYIGGGVRNAEQKDPTVQALGIRGHIYGARADLIILDDCVDLTNAHDFENQIEWVQNEVISRLSNSGVLLMVGTRLAARDLYSEIGDPERYPDELSPWTRLAMPAVLNFAENPEDWLTLWPRADRPDRGDMAPPDADGMYRKWDGPALAKKRARMSASAWARVYQQQQTSEDATFDMKAIVGCTKGSRLTGLIPRGMPGNRPEGMNGLVVLAGLDPATTGHTAMVVVGLDVPKSKRYVLDVKNKAGMKPDELRAQMYELTDHYQIIEWVIEKNGFQGFLAQDTEMNRFMAARGVVVRPHFTGHIKRDPDFGVAAMSGLFNGHETGDNLIELPSSINSEGVKALVEQLATWAPKVNKRQKTDAVMALWMAELACLARVEAHRVYGRSHGNSAFQTRWDKTQQTTYNLTEMQTAMANWG